MPGPKMKAALPSGDGNGLTAIITEMLNDPERYWVTIAIVDCEQATRKTDTGENIPTVRVRRIEAITDDADMALAESIMRRALSRRNVGGDQEELPFDIEQDLRKVFGDDDAG